MNKSDSAGLSRRAVLQGGGAAAVIVFGGACQGGRVALPVSSPGSPADGPEPDSGSLFLDVNELRTLDAVVERFIPADADPGASAAACAQAINLLLSAFAFDPPRIFAGGPFSDRGGHPRNQFADFVPLDAYEALAWRLKIEGSQGRPEREFNGPRLGWQQIYRQGLAQLNTRAGQLGAAEFADLPAASQDLLLRDDSDAAIARLVDVAFLHTLESMYGAPEYGGNRDLVGWGFTAYDGDVQPRGYSDEQVTTPDNPGLMDLLGRNDDGLPQAGLLPLPDIEQRRQIHAALRELIAMHSGELALGVMLASDGSLSRLQAEINRLRPRRQG